MHFLGKKRKAYNRPVLFGIIFIVIIILGFSASSFMKTALFLTWPFVRVSTYVVDKTESIQKTVGTSKEEFVFERTVLQQENERLQNMVLNLEKEKSETQTWTQLFPSTPEVMSLVRGLIISKPNQSPYDTFIIDAGSSKGIYPGAYMVINNTSVLGTIDSVEQNTSIGKLLSSPGLKTVGRLERTGYDVTLEGKGGGNMIVEVPKEIETALGDRVLYPTYNNRVIGVIRDITLDDRDATKKLYITLPTNILTLDHVYIEK